MRLPVEVHFSSMPPSASAEDAARRRIRRLDSLYPSVLSWEVQFEQSHTCDQPGGGYAVRVVAHRVGKGMATARAHSVDVLAAVRVAFEAIEHELAEKREAATRQATRWLASLRRHGLDQVSNTGY
jgi:hypothetical protein